MPQQPYNFRAAAFLALKKDGKVLMHLRINTDHEEGNYGLPAGYIDGGETVQEACAREAKEETGITIKSKDLRVVHVMHHAGSSGYPEYIQFYCTTEKWERKPYNAEPDRCGDISWFSLNDLPPNTITYIRQALENIEQGILFSSYGFKKEYRY